MLRANATLSEEPLSSDEIDPAKMAGSSGKSGKNAALETRLGGKESRRASGVV
jgi:hypothetical protein